MANINPKVNDFLARKKSPLTAEIQRVREIILETSDKVEEDIKLNGALPLSCTKVISLLFI